MLNIKFSKNSWVPFGFLLFAFALWTSIFVFGGSSYADESTHSRQISRFVKGNYHILSDLTTIPGYHATVALLAKATMQNDSSAFRVISFLLSLISLWVFYLLAKKLKTEDPVLKTAQFLFLPITFYYFPLLYTDIFCLLLVLTAFYFALSQKYKLSALFCLLSLLARQNSIVWVAFIWIYAYIDQFGFAFSVQKVLDFFKKTFGFLLVFLAFLLFVLWNKGIAIGDKELQQVGFHLGNIYFFLALSGLLFLPATIASFKNVSRPNLKSFLVYGIGFSVLVALSFLLVNPELHQYNLKLKFVRNLMLNFAYGNFGWLYLLFVALGYLAFFQMKLGRKVLLIFPFAFLSLVPSQLIEQRYYIIPLVLILLFRKEFSKKLEYLLSVWFLLISCALIFILLRFNIFF